MRAVQPVQHQHELHAVSPALHTSRLALITSGHAAATAHAPLWCREEHLGANAASPASTWLCEADQGLECCWTLEEHEVLPCPQRPPSGQLYALLIAYSQLYIVAVHTECLYRCHNQQQICTKVTRLY